MTSKPPKGGPSKKGRDFYAMLEVEKTANQVKNVAPIELKSSKSSLCRVLRMYFGVPPYLDKIVTHLSLPILSTCHFVNLTFCQLDILSTWQLSSFHLLPILINYSSCQLVISSTINFDNFSFNLLILNCQRCFIGWELRTLAGVIATPVRAKH
jgi:hypothetical protein